MNFSYVRVALSTLMLALAACATHGVVAPAGTHAAKTDGYEVSVVRTGYGVPHVTAKDWGSLGYGYGYSIAQDNLCTLADAFVTLRGERSRYFGAAGKAPYATTLEAASNLDSDFFFRLVADSKMIAGFRDSQEPRFNRLVAGYADGYSRYVAEIKAGEHPGRHADCRTAEWLGAIDSDDLFRRFYAANLALSETRMISAIANAAPPAAGAPVAQAGEYNPAALVQALDPTRLGSNAYAFGADATGSKHGLLFGNPHWMWVGMDRFYQVHLRIPSELDVQGASIMGVPLVLIGFNRDVAWSHTVSTAKRFTFYRLTLAKGDPTSYVYDGQVRKLQPTRIDVPVRQADGSLGSVVRTLYRSHFGPMIAKDWGGEYATTLRAANADNLRSFRNWMRWDQAKSLDEFIAIQKQETAIPWVNTIAAGRNDPRAWYADIGTIPNVSDAKYKACGVAPQTLDGSRADCEWETDADSVQPGTFGPARMPSLATRDFVANMNDSFWLANPHTPLTGVPQIIGGTDEPQSFRTRMGLTLVQQRLDGSDGLPGKLATSENIRQIVLNSRSMSAELSLDDVLKGICNKSKVVLAEGGSVDIAQACAVLRAWDRRGDVDSVGAHVWEAFWNNIGNEVPAAERWLTPFDPADPVGTPRRLNTAHPGMAQALAKAVELIRKGPVALDAPVGSYQFLADAEGRKIPLAGGCGGSGYFTLLCTRFSDTQATVMPHGNSYMQVVGFDDEGPQAWTMMLPSQSTDPASPYFREGTRRYSEKQWYRAPYTQAEIDAGTIERLQLSGAAR